MTLNPLRTFWVALFSSSDDELLIKHINKTSQPGPITLLHKIPPSSWWTQVCAVTMSAGGGVTPPWCLSRPSDTAVLPWTGCVNVNRAFVVRMTSHCKIISVKSVCKSVLQSWLSTHHNHIAITLECSDQIRVPIYLFIYFFGQGQMFVLFSTRQQTNVVTTDWHKPAVSIQA